MNWIAQQLHTLRPMLCYRSTPAGDAGVGAREQ
jgi:hypothetical protein